MSDRKLKVGIVGLQPGRSWAARAHVPALNALADRFEIAGIANSTLASSERAVAETGAGRAFASVAELVASREIDMVSVTVKVAHHLEIVKAALEAGKHAYCEWPLGNGLAEADALATLAREKGVLAVVGTQAVVAPEIVHIRRMVAAGDLGTILSVTVVARGGGWGGTVANKSTDAYLLDKAGGATMLTIPVGHMLAALTDIFGPLATLSSVLATRRPSARVNDTGEQIPTDAPDQVLVNGMLVSGAPVSIHYRGGMPRDRNGLLWEINGTHGDVRIIAPFGHVQLAPLRLEAAIGPDAAFTPIDLSEQSIGFPENPAAENVARIYARIAADLRDGTRTAPSFDDAVAVHRILAAIERSADDGSRIVLQQ
ncbi:Gfo/Idh/MocA family oxidoreductase [Sphingomonas sp. LB2R24]|uniref:Gfo/Idh/MocA family protein n=1 Tax=Sphingomonas sorbitolis TaxID=3096165 RepID=UPI002FC7A6CA